MTFPAANLDALLLDLLRANREKVAAWLRGGTGQLGISGGGKRSLWSAGKPAAP